ncbi:hypothetical protein GCM10023351_21850 [Microbacterium gilvum]|uniref:Uncharacterized protein n=1 Tax=Microbacterium gilvum TaxID=1336204 RepID=A0ABP9A9S0_9MICO
MRHGADITVGGAILHCPARAREASPGKPAASPVVYMLVIACRNSRAYDGRVNRTDTRIGAGDGGA